MVICRDVEMPTGNLLLRRRTHVVSKYNNSSTAVPSDLSVISLCSIPKLSFLTILHDDVVAHTHCSSADGTLITVPALMALLFFVDLKNSTPSN